MYSACMPNIQVRDVPADVHAALVARAAERNESLQHFLMVELRRIASTPSMHEVLDRIERRSGGRVSPADAVAALEAARAGR